MTRLGFLLLFMFSVMAGVLFSDQPAGKRMVVCPSSKENPRNSEGDIIALHDGSLLLAWSRFSGPEDGDTAIIAGKKSHDNGKTWDKEFVLQDNFAKQNVMSASFLRTASGKIMFFFLAKNAADDLQVYYKESRNEAKSWTAPAKITDVTGYHIMNNARVLQLSSGRILAPIAYAPDIDKDYKKQICFCYASDDDGKTWHKGKNSVQLNNTAAMEPGLVQLKNNQVLMIIRTELDRIYQACSQDSGETWTDSTAMDLTAPAAPSTISRNPATGDLIMVWNNNPLGNKAGWKGRTPLTIARSSDEGKSWRGFKDIESDPDAGYGYTSITWLPDRILLTYYHWKQGQPNFQGTDLIFRSIAIKDITE